MRRLLIVLALFIPAFAQTKHPFTFEDMMALKRVGEPIVSPDGKWVVFSVVDVDLAANKKTPHIWIVPITGSAKADSSTSRDDSQANHSASVGMTKGAEREIISDQDADRPRWAPDGKRLAFISNKEGGSQIWIAEFDGAVGTVTGVHKLTSIATEADGELWSPDGKNILFKSDVYPECTDEACNEKKVEEHEKSKVKALVFEHLLYRHWNAYKEGKRTHLLIVQVPAGEGARPTPAQSARDLTPGDYDAPVFSLGGQDDYAFSPDGQEICYTSNHDPEPAISTNNDLFIVSVNGGEAKNITAENKASDSTPLYSPDGKYIAYRAQQRPGYESDRFRLMLYDRKTGEKKNLIEHFDAWVGSFTWTPDSKTITFAAEHEGHLPIYVTSPGGDWGSSKLSTARRALVEGFNDDPVFAPDGKILIFTKMSLQGPTGIYTISADQVWLSATRGMPAVSCTYINGEIVPEFCRGPKPISHLNDGVLSEVSMSPLESFWFTGANGDKVEGFLVKPPNFDANKKYPVKFLIHGGPQGAWGDDWSYRWNPELFAANGYVVIMINFHGSTGYGQKFIDAINGDWGGAPFEDLMKGLDYAEQHYPFIDKDRECALGASYGGYMANWVLGHTNRFKCIVSHDGMFNSTSAWGTTEELWFNEWEFKGTPYNNRALYDKWSPHLSATNFKTPTLVVHGQLDYRLDVSEGFQLFTTLQRLGVPSKMLYFPDEGHWVLKPQNSQLWYKTVNDWVDQWTKK
jgi:dipeptidyl aminopeptidase/acylaminoacyl peptidase